MITEEQLKDALPSNLKQGVSSTLITNLLGTLNDPEFAEAFKENLLGYTHVLSQGRFKLTSYIDAVKYVSYKLMGLTNKEAWKKTFPSRWNEHMDKGTSDKDLSSYVAMYNKNILVNKIYEQTLIPSYVLNQHMYQDALNVSVDLMHNSKSDFVKQSAAKSVMEQLRMPETTKIQLDVGAEENSLLKDLKETSAQLVAQQRLMIESGAATAQTVAHSKVIEGEVVEDV